MKSTQLIDSFGRYHNYLRMSITEKCNLRCVYCMPADGVKLTERNKLMSIQERKRVISIFSKLGVDKIRFTGGEPTISNQLNELISYSKDCGIKSIGITTNGIELGQNKSILDRLILSGLNSINISLDTLNPKKFADITRRDEKGLYKVLSTLYYAVSKNELKVKLNCVLMKDFNDDEIPEIVDLIKNCSFDCRFIELMPFEGNEWTPKKLMSFSEAIDIIKQSRSNLIIKPDNLKKIDKNDTTKWYNVIDSQGIPYQGRLGFISSMTSHFCGGCNRLRITADGKLKVCLFGEDNLDITQLIRDNSTDEEIIDKIGKAVLQKEAVLGGHKNLEAIASSNNRPMILIGG